MKLSVVLLTLPLVVAFAAEKPAPKKTKAAAQATSSSAPLKQTPRVVVPPGFGPRIGAAETQPTSAKSPAPKPEPRPSARITPPSNPAPAVTIPADATEISPNVFRHTDAKGIAWLYSKTPFGVSKSKEDEAPKQRPVNGQKKDRLSNESPFGLSQVEEKGSVKPAAPAREEAEGDVTVKDLGDRVQFERKTPFGATRWERSKPELTDAERAIWEREHKKPASTADRATASRP